MKIQRGTVAVVVVLLGYVGMEAFAIRKASYRTEPAYIHNMLIEARTATEVCSIDVTALREGFNRTLGRVTERNRRDLAERYPQEDASAIDQRIAEQVRSAQSAVEAFLADKDCTDQEIKNHFQRYKIYARRG
jgi:hypothetical protein